MSRVRVLRALVFASLAALVFHTHVFVAFHPVRAKVLHAPVASADGLVRVTTTGFPQLESLRPPFALIARIKAPSVGSHRVRISFDGSPACERVVEGGASRRIDCAVTSGTGTAADREVVVSGPTTPWTLEYLELASHHGNATGALTAYIVPPASTAYDAPAAGWTAVVWLAVAAILLWLAPAPMSRPVRVAWRILAGLVVALLAVVQVSDRVSAFRVVLASGAFLVWLALLLAPRLWVGERWLVEQAAGLWRRTKAAGLSRMAPVFERHPRWRPGRARLRTAWEWLAPAIVVLFFCVPLFVNLREPDVRSDEAIYSYAVERILETGDWLTPRSIPSDFSFLEKPPLKFWLVAGGMRAGLLPTDERGMRWLDALFGAVAFLYVYALGRRLAGPLAGVTAVLVLFTLDPLVFEHGLRSNNMEAALFLSYCAGIFHFAAWVEAGPRRARGHAAAVCAAFFLGFMTKFVAALFLPAVCLAALAVRGGAWRRLRDGWRDWVLPALATVALAAPWFVYQSIMVPAQFWKIILGEHVYQRFTSSLDVAHLRPWWFYVVTTFEELRAAGTIWLVLPGLAALAVAAVRRGAWLARLILIWGTVPVAIISFGTSKLAHYAYPFWPALGLAAGLLVSLIVRGIDGPPGTALARWMSRLVPPAVVRWWTEDPGRRGLLAGLIAASAATAVWTAVRGSFAIGVGGVTYFSGTSVLPPLVLLGLLLLMAGGQSKWLAAAPRGGRAAVATADAGLRREDRPRAEGRPPGPRRARLHGIGEAVRRARGLGSAGRGAGHPALHLLLLPVARRHLDDPAGVLAGADRAAPVDARGADAGAHLAPRLRGGHPSRRRPSRAPRRDARARRRRPAARPISGLPAGPAGGWRRAALDDAGGRPPVSLSPEP